MKKWMLIGLLVSMSTVGCKKEPPPEPEKTVETPAPKPKVAKKKKKLPGFATEEPQTKVEGPATAADFEQEAEKSLHFENLELELDRLEAEITGG